MQSLIAEIAQLVERNLAKVEVAGPSPVFRSKRKDRPCGGLFVLNVGQTYPRPQQTPEGSAAMPPGGNVIAKASAKRRRGSEPRFPLKTKRPSLWRSFVLNVGQTYLRTLDLPSPEWTGFAEGPPRVCGRWNSNTGTLCAKPHHMPSSAQGVAPSLPPCAPWCGRSPNRTLSSTSYFAVGDNLLIISKIIKLGLPILVDPIHLFPCVSNTYLPCRRDGISPF